MSVKWNDPLCFLFMLICSSGTVSLPLNSQSCLYSLWSLWLFALSFVVVMAFIFIESHLPTIKHSQIHSKCFFQPPPSSTPAISNLVPSSHLESSFSSLPLDDPSRRLTWELIKTPGKGSPDKQMVVCHNILPNHAYLGLIPLGNANVMQLLIFPKEVYQSFFMLFATHEKQNNCLQFVRSAILHPQHCNA